MKDTRFIQQFMYHLAVCTFQRDNGKPGTCFVAIIYRKLIATQMDTFRHLQLHIYEDIGYRISHYKKQTRYNLETIQYTGILCFSIAFHNRVLVARMRFSCNAASLSEQPFAAYLERFLHEKNRYVTAGNCFYNSSNRLNDMATHNTQTNLIIALAERIAEDIGAVDGVVAVVLGGSWARGTALPASDIDLGIYYEPQRPPSIAALRAIAQAFSDHKSAELTEFGGWGPWINGGGWLRIAERPVDWLYRDLERVRHVIAECVAGRPTLHHQPGHPHGFHSHIYVGEVAVCRPLYDPHGTIAQLKTLTTPYPVQLKRALINTYHWQAGFALMVARKAIERADAVYVSGCLFQCVMSLAQVLFALNEQFFLNEKGAVTAIDGFEIRPDDWRNTTQATLAQVGATPDQLRASIEHMDGLVQRVADLHEK